MIAQKSLWGDEFIIKPKDDTDEILNKIQNPKEVKKVMSSKKISIDDKLSIIEAEVYRILGHYKDDTIVIKTVEEFQNYIDKAIQNKIIAIDTETNNTLNTFDCKIIGLCLYTPGMKAAYVPVNHVDRNTNERLNWQITEQQIHDQLQRIIDNNVYEIYHNAVFDIEVIQTTCGIRLKADWDTMIGAQLIDENEQKGLKNQYRLHINPGQEKYDIEHLFQKLEYAIVDPELFALYAATDSLITYRLYEWQLKQLSIPANADVLKLMKTIEIPVLEAIVNMEMTGVEIDLEYAKKMSTIYHAKADAVQAEIDEEMKNIYKLVDAWRKTAEANYHPPAKSKSGVGKSKNEQLPATIDFGSPTQMAILLYDILKAPVVNKSKPRTTDSAALEILAKDKHIKICELLLKKRDVDILINTFIDKLPEFAQKDGRVHPRYNSVGTACITSNSMLLTNNGYKTIGGLFNGNEIHGKFSDCNEIIYNKDFEAEVTKYKIAYYNVPTKKITLQGGYTIEGTLNHPIMCAQLYNNNNKKYEISRDFKQLSDISIGDRIPIHCGYNIFPNQYQKLDCKLLDLSTNSVSDVRMPEYCDEQFAELLGMYFADGCIKDNNGSFKIRITNSHDEVLNRISFLVKELFNLNSTVYTNDKHHTKDIYFGSQRISEIKRYFPRLARNKCVPDIIMQSPKSVVCAFIRGLTLDSSYCQPRHRLKMTLANPITYNFVKTSLLNIGIITSTAKDEYKSLHDHAGNPVEKTTLNHILISCDMYDKFIQEIGCIENRKIDLAPAHITNRFLVCNDVYYLKVTNIEDGVNNVYDLNVPETHSFIANGIINHNTGRFSCSNPKIRWGL